MLHLIEIGRRVGEVRRILDIHIHVGARQAIQQQ